MRRTLTMAASIAATLTLLATATACAGGSPTAGGDTPVPKPTFEAGTTMAEIADAGTISFGASPDQPGLSEVNLQGGWEGFNIDLAVKLANSLGLTADDIEWTNMTAANRIPFIEQGKIDAFVTALAITPERTEAIAIAGPYFETGAKLLVAKGEASKFESIDDIAPGTKICVLQGSQGQPRVAATIPQAEIVEFKALTDCERALEQGTVDAVDSTAPLLAGFVIDKPDAFELAAPTYGDAEIWGIGVEKQRTDLCEYFNEQLAGLFEDGTIEQLWQEHMGESGLEAPTEPASMDYCGS